MWKVINQYSLAWRPNANTGIVYLYFADGATASFQPQTVEELAAYGNILRNEKPVYYHTSSGDISTGREPTGEQEG